MAIVLASASPRRRQLLVQTGLLDFQIAVPSCDETLPDGLSPEEAVQSLSRRKAAAVASAFADTDILIAADTLVCLDGALLGKPRDRAEAIRMLTSLAGRTHEVFTGLTVRKGDANHTGCQRTEVAIRSLTSEEISAYADSGEPFDKAGAYAIQGLGALLVSGIRGDFYNVMGLPLCLLEDLLGKFGFSLFRSHAADSSIVRR